MDKPVLGITMGDPAGIGPEIVVKALNDSTLYDICRPVVFGDYEILTDAAAFSQIDTGFKRLEDFEAFDPAPGCIDVVDFGAASPDTIGEGKIQAAAGRASFEYVKGAIEAAIDGRIDAIATAPLNKEALRAAGVDFIGHTEMLGALSKSPDNLTMFAVKDLKIFFLTRHVSLGKAVGLITAERVAETLRLAYRFMRRLGYDAPRLAVAGLNPHAGEHGLFGREEVDEIEPAIHAVCADGIDAYGPVPADAVFHQAANGRYDAVLSLYHDQGHIASKMYDFDRTVSITLGLPFIRTSVDHGTAFDIAGQGVASPISMVEAIKAAAVYGKRYRETA